MLLTAKWPFVLNATGDRLKLPLSHSTMWEALPGTLLSCGDIKMHEGCSWTKMIRSGRIYLDVVSVILDNIVPVYFLTKSFIFSVLSRLSKMTTVSSFWIISNNSSKQWLATRDVRANWLKQSGTEFLQPNLCFVNCETSKTTLDMISLLDKVLSKSKCLIPTNEVWMSRKKDKHGAFTSLFSNISASPASCSELRNWKLLSKLQAKVSSCLLSETEVISSAKSMSSWSFHAMCVCRLYDDCASKGRSLHTCGQPWNKVITSLAYILTVN